ncbi:hypothetical protein [Candidatus Marinarcus aquaticus]|uniref:Uncharacterized protein n=1 Tax=Candidatus Marinarcus aquaticus TaxID=2044504 RepID=A0A4Q0XUQ9_9BACT|nr:hypothetical protein [Candidatus Marinarcus aquaticus]RXJ60695.1 hypothetical protein CRV04_01395 [Candidatus Marinarcus aquaticus]
MIEYTHKANEENDYITYNHFLIDDGLVPILYDDYYMYNTDKSDKKEIAQKLYDDNFVNKYDPVEHKQIFDLYINNESFMNKAKFIYSVVDVERYKTFVEQNPSIEEPNKYTLTYSVTDSKGVKVTMYHISITDIAFVF